ncbi:hypothetical protein JCM24511_05814 [Saitozyma sp. JCM 24511]|nr:hypothetical protein JCM24511_05814 [Saitozyma sp. JCM 24511]
MPSGFIVLASMRARPGRVRDIIDLLKSVVAASRSEKGTIQYQLAEGIDDPDEIRLWEEYASEEAFLSHKDSQYFQAFADSMGELIVAGSWRTEKYSLVEKI